MQYFKIEIWANRAKDTKKFLILQIKSQQRGIKDIVGFQNGKRKDRIFPWNEFHPRVEERIWKNIKWSEEFIPWIPTIEAIEKVAKVTWGSLPSTKDQFDGSQPPPTFNEVKLWWVLKTSKARLRIMLKLLKILLHSLHHHPHFRSSQDKVLENNRQVNASRVHRGCWKCVGYIKSRLGLLRRKENKIGIRHWDWTKQQEVVHSQKA